MPYRDPAEIAEVVRRFEACEYAPADFPHTLHLAVAAWYLDRLAPPQSLDRMRSSLLRFTAHHAVKAYHETLTHFWMLLVLDYMERVPGQDLTTRVNGLVSRYPDKNIVYRYYSRELLQSDAARTGWVPPDLQPFPPR